MMDEEAQLSSAIRRGPPKRPTQIKRDAKSMVR